MPRPEPHAPLAAAQAALEALGEKPPRRRPAYAWDQDTAALQIIIDRETPAFQARLRAAGYCLVCNRHIGRGASTHEIKCRAGGKATRVDYEQPTREEPEMRGENACQEPQDGRA